MNYAKGGGAFLPPFFWFFVFSFSFLVLGFHFIRTAQTLLTPVVTKKNLP
jgi:hypothetical protein